MDKKEQALQKRILKRGEKQEYDRKYRLLHLERKKETNRLWYLSNRETARKQHHKYYWINREKILDRVKNPETRRLYFFNRRRNDPAFRLRCYLGHRINQALKENFKTARSGELVGCQWSELRMWLEFQFQDGMTWENYGPIWHVDHIKPCASFDLSDPKQQKECFNYKNLQPLFAVENIKKGAR